MNEQLRSRLRALAERMFDVREQVAALQESKNRKPQEIAACTDGVAAVVAEYREILAGVPEAERADVERRTGRAVLELRQDTSWLPSPDRGRPVPLATDREWTVASDTPSTPASTVASEVAPRVARPASRRGSTGPRVGGEIDAWCGPCKDLRSHTIVAMVGTEPKQVICQSCGARHNFRLTPARTGKPEAPSPKKKQTKGEIEARRNEEARTALQKELTEATDVRPFDQKGRYRVGQIIEHPSFGRGKVEHVVRGSLLVRFRVGLRSFTLY